MDNAITRLVDAPSFSIPEKPSTLHSAPAQPPNAAERFVPVLPEEILILARRTRLMNTANGTAHPAIPPPPADASTPMELVATTASSPRPKESESLRGRFNERDPGPAAALLEELAVGDAALARELQQLEHRAIGLIADDLGSGALIEIQKAATAVRERITFTLKNARELREEHEKKK